MSYINEINETINNTVSNFIQIISEKYSLNYDDLYNEWNNNDSNSNSDKATIKPKPLKSKNEPQKKSESKSESKSSSLTFSNAELSLQTVDILKGMCKDRGLKCSGKKSELIDRLKEFNSTKTGNEDSTELVTKEVAKETVKVQTNKSKLLPDIFKKIEKTQFAIRRNNFGNFEHEETGFIFDDSKKVYGVQLKDGNIRPINKEDIDLCNKYKFPYVIPDNLNTADENNDILEEDEEVEYEEEQQVKSSNKEEEEEEVEIEEEEIEEEVIEEVEEEINEEDILQSDEEYEEVEEDE